jgi:hypothetical protein
LRLGVFCRKIFSFEKNILNMYFYLSKTHSDEIDENPVEVGKLGILHGSKDGINKLCDFFSEVKEYI